jgi:hypothetical protein
MLAGQEALPVCVVPTIDQSVGGAFKAACDEDWLSICGEEYCPATGIEPCGFVAMMVAAEPPPTTAAELAALSERLSDLEGFVRPRVRMLMEWLVARRRAYFLAADGGGDGGSGGSGGGGSGGDGLRALVESAQVDAMHPIGGMVGQWDVCAFLSDRVAPVDNTGTAAVAGEAVDREGRGGGTGQHQHPRCFLRNIQVGALGSWAPDEDTFFAPSDPPVVRMWVAEERPFRGEGIAHFMQQDAELMSLGAWGAAGAAERLQGGGVPVIVDARGHYSVYTAACVDGEPVLLLFDSLPVPPDNPETMFEKAVRAGLRGAAACAELEAGARAGPGACAEQAPIKPCRGGCGWDLGSAPQEYCSRCQV